jgi:hypothetical protein
MSAIAAPLSQLAPRGRVLPLGRAFVHPAFDLLVIGSASSLLLTPFLLWGSQAPALGQWLTAWLPVLVLLGNSAHFAASTVRLYTKPNAFRDMPFLTLGFPLVTLLLLTLALVFVDVVGRPLQTLNISWSPFHYGAQAYGLSLIYAYRSGCSLSPADKRLVRLACLLPFAVSLVGGYHLFGGRWQEPRLLLIQFFGWVAFALPALVVLRLYRQGKTTLPWISVAVLLSNCVWLITLGRAGAFAWATVFHGLQYLAIVTVFHVKDRLDLPGNRHGWAWHTATFYLACLALGYLLFEIWPFAYVLMGFGLAESMLLVAAVINLHHFIVDAFIWKLRQAPNYKIVTDAV